MRWVEGIGQHYRDANQHNGRRMPMFVVVKSTLGRDRVKLMGAKCHEARATEEK